MAQSPAPPGTLRAALADLEERVRRWGIGAWSTKRWTLTIGLTAFVIRALLVLLQPFTIVRETDAVDYQRLAVSLATGHGWGLSHSAPGGGPTALRAPLYPLFVAGMYKISGVHVTMARLGGALLGAFAVVLIMVATWMLWGKVVGLTAGVVAALFPPMVISSTGLMTEALAVPLEMAAVCCAICYRRSPRIRWVVLCGISLGLAVLTRPNLAVLAIPLVLLALIRPLKLRHAAAALTIVVAGTLTVTPWLIRDRLVFHQWVPITTQSGAVVAGTYNHTSATNATDPAAWLPFTWDPADRALIAKHPHANELEESSLLQAAGTSYMKAHPSYVLEVAYQNTRHLFDLVPLRFTRADISTSYGLPPIWGDADAGFTIVFLLLALLGLVLPLGRKVSPIYWVFPGVLWITTVVLQGIPRFRAEIDPFVIQFAAVSLVSAWTALRAHRRAEASLAPEIGTVQLVESARK